MSHVKTKRMVCPSTHDNRDRVVHRQLPRADQSNLLEALLRQKFMPGATTDVLVEEDCTRSVARIPSITPAMGLSLMPKSLPAPCETQKSMSVGPLPPIALKAMPMRSKPSKKAYSEAMTPTLAQDARG